MKTCMKMTSLDFKTCFVAAPGGFANTKFKDGQAGRDLGKSSGAVKGITNLTATQQE